MTREQILRVPRHSFAPLNNAQMRFFGVRRQERRIARQELRDELQPRNELTGTAGLNTPVDRNTGFNLASLPAKKKRALHGGKKNSMRGRWIAKNINNNETFWKSQALF